MLSNAKLLCWWVKLASPLGGFYYDNFLWVYGSLLTCLGLVVGPLLKAKQSEIFPEVWSIVTCRS